MYVLTDYRSSELNREKIFFSVPNRLKIISILCFTEVVFLFLYLFKLWYLLAYWTRIKKKCTKKLPRVSVSCMSGT